MTNRDRRTILIFRSACRAGWLALALAGCLIFPPPAAAPPADLVAVQEIVSGLTAPIALATAGDGGGRLFIAVQSGRIRIVQGGALLPEAFLDIADRITPLDPIYDERGLLGMAFHPDYPSNGRFFVIYNAPPNGGTPAGFDSVLRLSEFHVRADSPDRADADDERLVLTIDKPQSNHNGGQLAFGPDGFLYAAVGDGGAGNDVGNGHTPGLGNGQDKSTLLGKILRIDVDGAAPYAIPADNPFVGDGAARPEIWAYGFRNPWRFSFDRGGAQRLFAGDVGQNLREEFDIVTPGGNYGWRLREGSLCFDPAASGAPPATCTDVGADGAALTPPILDYPHVDENGSPVGVAVVGGYVYRGSQIPGLAGQYVFADWSRSFLVGDGTLFAANEAPGGAWSSRVLGIAGTANNRLGRFILSFGQDDEGELYLLASDSLGPDGATGRLFKIVAAPEE